MRRITAAALVAASVLALAACQKPVAGAAASIDGTWKADPASVKIDTKPDEFLLKDGKFSCRSCNPPIEVAADGAFHPVAGRAYWDNTAVKVDDDRHMTQTSRKGERTVDVSTYEVSPDGKTLTVAYTDSTVSNAKPVTGKLKGTRVGDAPAGAHAVSGSWKMDTFADVSDEGSTFTIKTDGDTLHYTSPGGIAYDAPLDGTPAPIKGDIAGTTASVTKAGASTWVETDRRKGKVVLVNTMTVDGDTMHIVSEVKHSGSVTRSDAKRS
jgi:hypothetical protein